MPHVYVVWSLGAILVWAVIVLAVVGCATAIIIRSIKEKFRGRR
jgi:hypothetical protein